MQNSQGATQADDSPQMFPKLSGSLCLATPVLAESLWADGWVDKTFWVPLPSIALPWQMVPLANGGTEPTLRAVCDTRPDALFAVFLGIKWAYDFAKK